MPQTQYTFACEVFICLILQFSRGIRMICKCTRSVKPSPQVTNALIFEPESCTALHTVMRLHMLTYRRPSPPHLVASDSVRPAAVTLLSDRELDTLTLGQRDPWLLLANDDNVGLTSGELVVNSILQVDNVEASIMALTVRNDTDTTHVTTTGDHDNDTSVELDEVGDLAGGKVDLDGVVDLDGWVRVADTTQ